MLTRAEYLQKADEHLMKAEKALSRDIGAKPPPDYSCFSVFEKQMCVNDIFKVYAGKASAHALLAQAYLERAKYGKK